MEKEEGEQRTGDLGQVLLLGQGSQEGLGRLWEEQWRGEL